MTLSAFHPGGDPGIATEASSDRLSQTQAQTHCPNVREQVLEKMVHESTKSLVT